MAQSANTNLSNLDAPAINRSLIPGNAYSNLDLGSSTLGWRNIYFAHTDSISPNMMYYRGNKFLHVTGGGTSTTDESLYLGEYAGLNAKSTDNANNGCVGIGYLALNLLGTGYPFGTTNLGVGNHNTAIGWLSMRNMNGSSTAPNQAADKNTMVGSRSGQLIFAGRENTGIGYNVFYQGSYDEDDAFINGTGNTGVGGAVTVSSVSHGVLGLLTIGNYNTVFGYGSGIRIDAGSNNLIAGDNAGVNLDDGLRNTIIGSSAAAILVDGNDNIFIGQNANYTADVNNFLNIGNTIYGDLATDEISIGSDLTPSMFNVGTTNQFQVSSTGRFAKYAGSTPANGQLLIGDGADMELATLTEGSAIDVTNGAASITVTLNINELPTETNADVDEDFFPVYDASESANNKMNLETMLAEYVTEYRRHRFDYYNEFINGIGTSAGGNDIVSVNSDGGGSISAAATTATNVVGLVRSSTGNTDATGRTSCSTGAAAVALGGGTWTYEMRINALPLLSNASTDPSPEIYQVLVGFFDVNTTQNQTDGIYFLYDRAGVTTGSAAGGSIYWQTATVSNSTNRTFTTTSIEVLTGVTTLKIVVNADATQVDFYLNDNATAVATHTNAATIPDGANRACGFGWMLIKSTGTANRAMDIDYISAQCDYTTAK